MATSDSGTTTPLEKHAGEKVEITANVNDDRHSEGIAYIKHYSPPERMMAAIKKLAIVWGIAILCILIPVFDFVLVPLGLILGVFFAHRTYKSEGLILSGSVKCPHCQTEVPLKKGELRWPLSEICQGCARVVRISRLLPGTQRIPDGSGAPR